MSHAGQHMTGKPPHEQPSGSKQIVPPSTHSLKILVSTSQKGKYSADSGGNESECSTAYTSVCVCVCVKTMALDMCNRYAVLLFSPGTAEGV